MNIADMRVRVTFQKNTIVSDKYGNRKQTWADYFSCHYPQLSEVNHKLDFLL